MTRPFVVHGFSPNAENLIYGLIDPRTRLIRYIGMSSTGASRPRHHACPSQLRQNSHRASWIRNLLRSGRLYEIVVLEVLPNANDLDEAECWWIAFGKACGWLLTNAQDGGAPSIEALKQRAVRQQKGALELPSSQQNDRKTGIA